jgi:hypothetical protein
MAIVSGDARFSQASLFLTNWEKRANLTPDSEFRDSNFYISEKDGIIIIVPNDLQQRGTIKNKEFWTEIQRILNQNVFKGIKLL